MANRETLTNRVVIAIGDARPRLRARLAADGTFCTLDQEALLLVDVAYALAESADIARRRRELMEQTGETSPWLDRVEREARQFSARRLAEDYGDREAA